MAKKRKEVKYNKIHICEERDNRAYVTLCGAQTRYNERGIKGNWVFPSSVIFLKPKYVCKRCKQKAKAMQLGN